VSIDPSVRFPTLA